MLKYRNKEISRNESARGTEAAGTIFPSACQNERSFATLQTEGDAHSMAGWPEKSVRYILRPVARRVITGAVAPGEPRVRFRA